MKDILDWDGHYSDMGYLIYTHENGLLRNVAMIKDIVVDQSLLKSVGLSEYVNKTLGREDINAHSSLGIPFFVVFQRLEVNSLLFLCVPYNYSAAVLGKKLQLPQGIITREVCSITCYEFARNKKMWYAFEDELIKRSKISVTGD